MSIRSQYTYTPGYDNNKRTQQRAAQQKPQPQARAPQRQPQGYGYAPRKPMQAAPAKRASGDTVILTLLFIIAPLCGILGVFFTTFLWVFIGVTLLALAAMWALGCFEPRGRAFLSGVLLVLSAVALIAVIDMSPQSVGNYPPLGGDPTTQVSGMASGNPSTQGGNPLYVGMGVNPTPTAPIDVPSSDPDALAPQTDTTQPPPSANNSLGSDTTPWVPTTAAETVLQKYMELWQAKAFEDMVQYALPSWCRAQASSYRSLFFNHSNWIVNSWKISSEAGSPAAEAVNLTVVVDLTTEKIPQRNVKYQYTAVVLNVDGTWYVDPDSMRTGIEIKEATPAPESQTDPNATAQPTAAPTTSPKLKLWYNSDGGSYYHLEQKCSTIAEKNYKYMKSFTYSQLGDNPYSKLKPCAKCGAPAK